MNISKRHHYIPEFFIKGFTGEDGKLAVYNCKKKKIERLRMSPKQIFYKWNRNTFNLNNEKTDFVEHLFKRGEDLFAPVYKKMTDDFKNYELDYTDMLHVIFYLGVLNASLPVNDGKVEAYIKDSSQEDLLIKIDNFKTNGIVNDDDFFEKIKEEPSFIQSAKILKATADFLKNTKSRNLDDWKTFYTDGKEQYHLIGDNPIILRDEPVDSIYDSELIFPLTKGITIFHVKGKCLGQYTSKDRVIIDVLTVLQSKVMVCGPNTEYLEKIVEMADKYPNQRMVNMSKDKIFKAFE